VQNAKPSGDMPSAIDQYREAKNNYPNLLTGEGRKRIVENGLNHEKADQ
jgi:hypothetical protein